jgi:hypothetical protein
MPHDPAEDVLDLDAERAARKAMDYETTEFGAEDMGDLSTRSERSQKRRFVVTAEDGPPMNLTYHPGGVIFYSPPRQRQRWGQTQVLPRVNWGDLFFDLFYVAATYNVSYILTDQPDREGLLYAAGTFLPVMAIWSQKVFYDSRFVYEDDLIHRVFQIAVLLVLATAVVHIRPVGYMSNASGEVNMFFFSLMLVLERVLAGLLSAEVYFFGVGQRKNLKHEGKIGILESSLAGVFYAAALVVAAKEYYGDGENDYHRRVLAAASDSESETADYTSAGDTESSATTNLPIWLILAGHIAYTVVIAVRIICFWPAGGIHKEL